jgi:hypothetical protein
MPTSSGARSVRSTAFAGCAVGLALGAHVTAGGEVPDLLPLLLLAVLAEAASSTFARRPRGAIATAVALLSAQVVLHGAFMMAVPHTVHVSHLPSPPMLVAHGIAALVLGVLLARGERLIRRVARVLVPVALLRPFRPLPVRRLVIAASSDAPRLRPSVTVHDLSRRGPPEGRLATRT